jgi:hypothetical protein
VTRLSLQAADNVAAGDAPARTARALAALPRLAHLRLLTSTPNRTFWASPEVAAALARCPALRVLEVETRNDSLWRRELGPVNGQPCPPRPPRAWSPFAEALKAGGCRATVRMAPASTIFFTEEFDVDV